jgi:hypothetical protein
MPRADKLPADPSRSALRLRLQEECTPRAPGRLAARCSYRPDPIEIIAYSATVSPELAERVEAADLEVAATAEPTPYVHEVIAACHESGRTIAVVSNNNTRAVTAYIERHGLSDGIARITARTSSDPALLKPSPHLIEGPSATWTPIPLCRRSSATPSPTSRQLTAPESPASVIPTSPVSTNA